MGYATSNALHNDIDIESKKHLPKYRTLLCMDGESEHLKYVMKLYSDSRKIHDSTVMDTPSIEIQRQKLIINMDILKFPGSCSKTTQPQDVAPSFMIEHQFWKSNQYKHFNPDNCPAPPYITILNEIFKNVDAASKRTFLRYFQAKEYCEDVAYSKNNILAGWYKSLMHCHEGKVNLLLIFICTFIF